MTIRRLFLAGGLFLTGLLPVACGASAPAEGAEDDRIATRVAEDLAVAATLTAAALPAPGPTATEATLAMPDSDKIFEEVIAAQCLKRREEPADVIGTAVFLASKESDFITGQLIVVDGGKVML